MRLYFILASLLLLLLPWHVAARQPKDPIRIYDAAGDSWDIRGLAAEFRDAGVDVQVKVGKAAMCEANEPQGPPRTAVMCEADLPYPVFGLTTYGSKHRAFIQLDPETTIHRQTACHEMMHDLTGIPDRPAGVAPRDDSCVWGYLDHLGAFDIEYIQSH